MQKAPIQLAGLFVMVVFSIILIESCIFAQWNDAASAYSELNNCGPRCLLIVAKMLGIKDISLERIVKLCGKDDSGTTMYQLYKAAREIGLRAIGVRLTSRELAWLGLPTIAFVDDRHYIAIEDVEGESVHIFEPDGSSHTFSVGQLEHRWKGYSLVVARKDDLKSMLKLVLVTRPLVATVFLIGSLTMCPLIYIAARRYLGRIFGGFAKETGSTSRSARPCNK